MPKFFKILMLLSCLMLSCEEGAQNWKCFYGHYYANVTNYEVKPNAVTPSGIRVDTGGYSVDLLKLDARIAEIESCIREVTRQLLTLPPEQITKLIEDWDCMKLDDQPLNRDCLIIRVVDPDTNCARGPWQMLPVEAPAEGCLAKGLKPTAECPCRWRTVIQDQSTIITPPAMYLWEIGKIMTSCSYIWSSDFAKCLACSP